MKPVFKPLLVKLATWRLSLFRYMTLEALIALLAVNLMAVICIAATAGGLFWMPIGIWIASLYLISRYFVKDLPKIIEEMREETERLHEEARNSHQEASNAYQEASKFYDKAGQKYAKSIQERAELIAFFGFIKGYEQLRDEVRLGTIDRFDGCMILAQDIAQLLSAVSDEQLALFAREFVDKIQAKPDFGL